MANPDTAGTTVGTAVTINVLANDTATTAPIDPASVQVSFASTGTAVAAPNGVVTFTPSGSLSGTATFTYTVADTGGRRSAPATVTVGVSAVSPDSREPNNTFATATDLGTGDKTITGLNINTSTDVDYFKWRSTGSGVATFDVDFLQARGDIDFAVYDANQNLLGSSSGLGDGETVSLAVTNNQTLYLKVLGFNGQVNSAYSLTIDGPTGGGGGGTTGSISGSVYIDANRNGVRDSRLVTGSNPDVVYVVDISGSTGGAFVGSSTIGDFNNDGRAGTILDAELAAFAVLNQSLIDRGLGTTARVSIVAFESDAANADMNPNATGVQLSIPAGADNNRNGIPDVKEILGQYTPTGGTNYVAALQQTAATFTALGTAQGRANVVFISDGVPGSNDYADEVASLKAAPLRANIRAFGAGSGAQLAPLQVIDPNAQIFTNTNDLLNVFGGLQGGTGGTVFTENGQRAVRVYVDSNNNDAFDTGERNVLSRADDPATTTVDETGFYSFTGLASGTYVVREIPPTGYAAISPPTATRSIVVGSGQNVVRADFGNIVARPPVVSSLTDSPDPVTAGSPVTLTATGVTDPDNDVANVTFYRESNGVAGLQAGASGDAQVGIDSSATGGYTAQVSTTGLAVACTRTTPARPTRRTSAARSCRPRTAWVRSSSTAHPSPTPAGPTRCRPVVRSCSTVRAAPTPTSPPVRSRTRGTSTVTARSARRAPPPVMASRPVRRRPTCPRPSRPTSPARSRYA